MGLDLGQFLGLSCSRVLFVRHSWKVVLSSVLGEVWARMVAHVN